MIIETKTVNDFLLATILVKEANLNTSVSFRSEITAIIDQGHKAIIVDFENVDYVDSSFLGALVSCLKYALANKADVSVISLNKDIKNLFQMIRMDKVFKIHDDVPEYK